MAKPENQTILVTGGSGFVAAHVLNTFLNRGYNVRTTVRSEDTAEKVRTTHGSFGDKLSFVIVKDAQTPGAFDKAVQGVDGVIHTASPFTITVDDNEKDLLQPAINGTTEILQSIHRLNPKVKRVVITSSFAALWDVSQGSRPGYTYTEADWNPITYEVAAKKDTPAGLAYMASKKLAEAAAVDFVKNVQPSFSVTRLCPPSVFGPLAHFVSSLDKLNASSAEIYRFINGSESSVPITPLAAFVDVRDLAEAHLRAYETAEAAGQRYLICGGSYSNQQICDIIRSKFPEKRSLTPEGNLGAPLPETFHISNAKAKKELGMTFRVLEDTIYDQVTEFISLEKKFAINT